MLILLALLATNQRQGKDRVQVLPAILVGSGLIISSALGRQRRRFGRRQAGVAWVRSHRVAASIRWGCSLDRKGQGAAAGLLQQQLGGALLRRGVAQQRAQ